LYKGICGDKKKKSIKAKAESENKLRSLGKINGD